MRMERFPGLRKALPPQLRSQTQPYTFPAPIGGWVTNQSLVKSKPMTAQRLENWVPTSTGIRLRGGSAKRATIGSDPTESFITYNAGGIKRIWACDESAIYDVTTPADPDTPPSPAVSGQTSGYYSYVNFTTSGGSFVTAVNGTDEMQLYDGGTSTWMAVNASSSPAITGVLTSKLSQVWLYRNRQFFIQGGTMKAHYLGVDSIGGALGTINLSGVFQRGGSLLFGATWSLDAGDGIDDKCVFVTTEGEVAIYEGANPAGSTAAEWNLVGRYDISAPLGHRGTMRAGGDLVILTREGIVPISAAINKDAAALSLAAISANIEPDWKREATRRNSLPWEIIKWPEKNYAIVSLPITSDSEEPWQFCINLQTGAWCKFSGWYARCLEYFNGRVYFGTNDGEVHEAEIGGIDGEQGIEHVYVGNPDHFKLMGRLKTVTQARATYVSSTPFKDKVSFSTNYNVELPTQPDAYASGTSDAWDVGLWDVMLWDQTPPASATIGGLWRSIGRTGYVFQPQVQITSGTAIYPNTELSQLDVMFEAGGVVT